MRIEPLLVASVLALPLLGGCARLPVDDTSHFSYVAVSTAGGGAHTATMLWPDACQPQPAHDPSLGATLPLGCANGYNLLHMAEHEGDLVRGRRLGPALAAPSARAAQKYIDGGDGAVLA